MQVRHDPALRFRRQVQAERVGFEDVRRIIRVGSLRVGHVQKGVRRNERVDEEKAGNIRIVEQIVPLWAARQMRVHTDKLKQGWRAPPSRTCTTMGCPTTVSNVEPGKFPLYALTAVTISGTPQSFTPTCHTWLASATETL